MSADLLVEEGARMAGQGFRELYGREFPAGFGLLGLWLPALGWQLGRKLSETIITP